MSELEAFYRTYDRAVTFLPSDIRTKADFRRCTVGRNGALTFLDEYGERFAIVDANGALSLPHTGEANPPPDTASKAYALSVAKSMALAFADSVMGILAKEIAGIRAELTAVVGQVHAMEASGVTKALDMETYETMGELAEQVQRLEAHMHQMADEGFRYRGQWRDGMKSKRGDAYTRDGSLWRAVQDTDDKPHYGSPDWHVVARKGRDAQ